MCKDGVLMQYMHDYTLAIFSKQEPISYQINNTQNNISEGFIKGKDYVGMSKDSSISYTAGNIAPGEEVIIDILIAVYDNKNSIEKILKKIDIIIKKQKLI